MMILTTRKFFAMIIYIVLSLGLKLQAKEKEEKSWRKAEMDQQS